MANKVFKMTAAGKAELEAELEHLTNEGRADIAEKLRVARSYGDLSENSEYEEARNEQDQMEARIRELEYQLKNAVIVEHAEGDDDTVTMDTVVNVVRKSDKAKLTYKIVDYTQSNPAEGLISDESPIGKALMGAKVGDTVTVEAPVGSIDFEIKKIKKDKKKGKK